MEISSENLSQVNTLRISKTSQKMNLVLHLPAIVSSRHFSRSLAVKCVLKIAKISCLPRAKLCNFGKDAQSMMGKVAQCKEIWE